MFGTFRKTILVQPRRWRSLCYEGCGSLRAFPYSGRKGRIDGTRELTFPGLPYIVVYRIEDQVVDVLRIYHGAQDWP